MEAMSIRSCTLDAREYWLEMLSGLENHPRLLKWLFRQTKICARKLLPKLAVSRNLKKDWAKISIVAFKNIVPVKKQSLHKQSHRSTTQISQ
jgi:hypothetical protein